MKPQANVTWARNLHEPNYSPNFAGRGGRAMRYLVPFILKRPGKVERW